MAEQQGIYETASQVMNREVIKPDGPHIPTFSWFNLKTRPKTQTAGMQLRHSMQRLCSGIGKHTSEKPHNILVVWTGFSQLGAKSLSLPGKFPCCLQRSCFIIFIPRTRAENGGIQITLAGGSIHGGPPIAGRYLTENLENPEKKGDDSWGPKVCVARLLSNLCGRIHLYLDSSPQKFKDLSEGNEGKPQTVYRLYQEFPHFVILMA